MTAPDRPLEAIRGWPTAACAGYLSDEPGGGRSVETAGPADRVFAWASVTKVVTAMATWIAVEEGTVRWDQPAGPPGSTLRHLLAHASGLAPGHDQVLAPPGRMRIYSNRGFEVVAEVVADAAGMAFDRYTREAVLVPLGMGVTTLADPAAGAAGPLSDLLRLAGELLHPTLFAATTLAEVASSAFPGLAGVLPGFGSQKDNAWGLGVEIRDGKAPHWTGRHNSPRTFGHFGRSGSFLWVDPDAGMAAASLAERPFGPWAIEAWPELSDRILAAG